VAAIVEQRVQLRVHLRQVVALEEIVDVDLPVAVELVAHALAEYQHRAGWQTFIDTRDQPFERWRRLQRGEHETVPLRDPRLRQPDCSGIEARRASHLRRTAQAAIERIGPSVVSAGQGTRGFAVTGRERTGAMATDVM